MSTKNVHLITFIKEVMRRRKRLLSQLATDIGVSHATVSRWLSGKDVPSIKSCVKLAEYSGTPVERVLYTAGHLISKNESRLADLPEFREYARSKYPHELDEDMIIMIEDLIERRRHKRYKNRQGNP